MNFKRRLSWIIWGAGGPIHLCEPLKVKNFLQLKTEESQQKSKSVGFYTQEGFKAFAGSEL